MKIRFSIHYRTIWGQQLMVSLRYCSQDGSVRKELVAMNTDDGDHWWAETAVIASRRSPVVSYTYYYIVADGEGRELRREWTLVDRTYDFDASKTFLHNDRWRDLPINSHLYTRAYEVSKGMKHEQEAIKPQQPIALFRKTVLFRVSAPQLTEGQAVAVVGSHPSLGAWNPTQYRLMEYVGQKDWMLSLNVDWIGMPLEYKYVVVDIAKHELVAWEEGDNRTVSEELNEGEVLVMYGEPLRLAEPLWRMAGVAVPVFSLRSEHSYGVGDFGDLYRMVDWAAETGMRMIQVLPVNDTTHAHSWGDSCPYNIMSAFALHPQYLDLEQLGVLKDKQKMTQFYRRRSELNALSYSDYEAVERVKADYVHALFEEQGNKALDTVAYKEWEQANNFWLEPYLAQCWADRKQEGAYVQYHLHVQLKRAADYARSKGVMLKGDLPVGFSRDSVEVKQLPELFHMDMQMGTPPDVLTPQGQNWGYPTYYWENERTGDEGREKCSIMTLLRQRLSHMEQYFDALRVDHILGYFRVWEIPTEQLFATMGHFSPALPLTEGEVEYFGLPFRKDFLTRPFINDRTIDRIFGIHADYVRNTLLAQKPYGLYELKPEVNTQQKVRSYFEGKGDENSMWIRDGLYRLVANVLLLEDPKQEGMYHPRIAAYHEPVFEALSNEERDAYMRLYNNYFYQRHAMFWGDEGYKRLQTLFGESRMLICAEDLGQMPECVAPVLEALHILPLEIQQLPKQSGVEYNHLDGNPVCSVATITTHDMAPLRQWWEENPERVQRFYTTMLQKQGRMPEHLPAHLAEEIVARHLYSPSMLCVLSLQDWLSMNGELRRPNAREERINLPSDPFNHWQWRMHLTIEALMKAEQFNTKLKTMISRSKR